MVPLLLGLRYDVGLFFLLFFWKESIV